jgi:sodium transport system permease protein
VSASGVDRSALRADSPSLRRALVVFWKEVVDNLRDRRSVGTALFSALLGPLLLVPLLAFQARTFDRGATRIVSIPVEAPERAPGLVDYLHQHGIETLPAPADPAEAVRDLKYDLVLVIPPGYADDFRAGRPAAVRIVTDHSRTTAAGIIGRVHTALENYSMSVGAYRLVARGTDPNVVAALAVELDDVATPESEGAMLLGIVPLFLITTIFLGGLYVAVDVTAGERERGSLEPLLATPVTTTEVVLGKLGAVVVFALLAMAVTLLGFFVVINLPFAEIPGLKFKLGPLGLLEILATLVPLLLPAAALQMLVAGRSRTVKEALTAASVCSMLPMVPGLLVILAPFKTTTQAMLVPLYGQNLLMTEVLRAAPFRALDLVVAAAAATLLGVVLTAATIAQAGSARMLRDG